jgi:hypothetical protein
MNSRNPMGRRNATLSILLACAAIGGVAATASAQTGAQSGATPKTISLSTVTVGAPNNASVWIIPFYNSVYQSQATCLTALNALIANPPATFNPAVQKETIVPGNCVEVGGVPYTFNIGETELTTAQWVAFLNTADPLGTNRHHLWDAVESSKVWPKYGSINRNPKAPVGQRYVVASQQWANKPYNAADFTRAARFVNSLQNGKVLSKTTKAVTTVAGASLTTTTYRVRLSPITETGQYTLSKRAATRNRSTGFVVTSQDEWIKAAYFDPSGGGTFSYWDYPTNPGVFGGNASDCQVETSGCNGQPSATTLNPLTGAVTNAGTQPLATYIAAPNVPNSAPDWCPSPLTSANCSKSPTKSPINYTGNVSTVGQALTRSPWGTLDQGGNVVEITDTIAPPPAAGDNKIVWRRWHGGVVTATAYQMWISAVGVTPQTIPGYGINPFRGIRVGVLGR